MKAKLYQIHYNVFDTISIVKNKCGNISESNNYRPIAKYNLNITKTTV